METILEKSNTVEDYDIKNDPDRNTAVIKWDGYLSFQEADLLFSKILPMIGMKWTVEVHGDDYSSYYGDIKYVVSHDYKSYVSFREEVHKQMKIQNMQLTGILDLSMIDVSNMHSISLNHIYNSSPYRFDKLNITGWDTSKCRSISFEKLIDITEIIGIENLDVSRVVSASYMFSSCEKLKKLNLSKWNLSSNWNCECMFDECRKLKTLKLSETFVTNRVRNMDSMFSGCAKLKKIDKLECFDVSNVSNMNMVFAFCYELSEVNISGWKPDRVETARLMFNTTPVLKYAPVENWKMEKLENAEMMFCCSGIEKIDLRNWNPVSLKDMRQFLYECKNLKEADLTGFNSVSLERMDNMLRNTFELKTVKAAGMNVSNVICMEAMFMSASKLETLDLTGWIPNRYVTLTKMFDLTGSLKNVDITGWKLTNTQIGELTTGRGQSDMLKQ